MVFERLLNTRLKYFLLPALMVLFTTAGYFISEGRYFQATLLFICGLAALLLVLWIYDGTNKAMAAFFDALHNNDTTIQFPSGVKNKSLGQLYESMNKLNSHFQNIRMQNEYNEKYYLTLIRNAAAGMMVVNGNNDVVLINNMACRYAGISPDSTNPNLLGIKNPLFYDAVCKLQPGEDITYKHVLGNDFQLLSFRATLLRKNDLSLKLISIQDIRHELESKELESYRKLISVLTHEIMNLISPLTSVSRKLYSTYHMNEKPITLPDMNDDILKTTLNSLQVIDEQTCGLLNFIDNYRRLSHVPSPEMKAIDVEEWVEQLKIVYNDKMRENEIAFTIHYDRVAKTIWADKKLLNQVIINLVNNAFDALMETDADRKLAIEISSIPHNRMRIKIINNGPQIPHDLQEKIFVPFFTTKTTGSGIGLSICQEIIRLHNGSLMVVSGQEGQTSFIMEI
jgi:two-component system, NtrC family, nitrogen regulation sensor histidine kinase NtrY